MYTLQFSLHSNKGEHLAITIHAVSTMSVSRTSTLYIVHTLKHHTRPVNLQQLLSFSSLSIIYALHEHAQ